MSDTLSQICTKKREHVAQQKRHVPLSVLEEAIRGAGPVRRFGARLSEAAERGNGLIAEVKKASPSKGVIRTDFDPVAIARAYEASGAACISILTDEPYFQGRDLYLQQVREAVALPLLRKDFMVDPYQIFESRALGADCILLIMAALGDAEAAEMEALARDLGMDVLIEVHDEEEMSRAAQLKSPLLGINNRNLKTLEVSLQTAERLAPLAPGGRMLICESGVETHADIQRMNRAGIRCFLVGESLMRAPDIATATRALLGA